MNNKLPSGTPNFVNEIGAKADRKLRARRDGSPGVWFGLGMMGLIGWSITVPTLLGAGLGLWLDANYPASHRWTIALLMAGLVIGCWNAWRWVAKEENAMHEAEKEDHE